jgi:hypothetical protein
MAFYALAGFTTGFVGPPTSTSRWNCSAAHMATGSAPAAFADEPVVDEENKRSRM